MDITKRVEKLHEKMAKSKEEQPKRFLFRSVKIYYLIGCVIALLILCVFFLTPYIKKTPIDIDNDPIGTVLDFGNDTSMQLLEWVYNPQDQAMEIMLALDNSVLAEEPNLLIDLFDHNGKPIGLTVAYDSPALVVLQGEKVPKAVYYRLSISMKQTDMLGETTIDKTQLLYQVNDSLETTQQKISPDKTNEEFLSLADQQRVRICKDRIAVIDSEIEKRQQAIQKLSDNIETYQSKMETASDAEKKEYQAGIEQAMIETDNLNQKIEEYKADKELLEEQIREYQ